MKYRIPITRALAAIVLAIAAGSIGIASPANAGVLDLTCGGTEAITLSPGLLLTPQTVTVTSNYLYTPCVSASDPTLTAGVIHTSATATLSCLQPNSSFSGTRTFTWNNSQTSVFAFNETFTTVGAQYVDIRTGTITSGEFAGDTVVETVTGPTVNLLDCLAPPGITSRTSVITLEITSI